MHRSRLGNIVIDCPTDDLSEAAAFWSAALGYPPIEPEDSSDTYIQLATPPGEVQVILQKVEHDARVHLDIETDSIEAEVERLGKLGASIVSRKAEWVVMQAPSGQRFCVGKPYRSGFEQGANSWD